MNKRKQPSVMDLFRTTPGKKFKKVVCLEENETCSAIEVRLELDTNSESSRTNDTITVSKTSIKGEDPFTRDATTNKVKVI